MVRRMLSAACCLLLFLRAAHANTASVVEQVDCELKPAWSTSSADLYALAHTWSKTHIVEDWTFSVADGCSHAVYRTRVHVPSALLQFWKRDSMSVGVDKLVCVREKRLRETVIISNAPFVGEIVVHVEGSVAAGQVSLRAEYEVPVPWYLSVVEKPVHTHVQRSVLEYLRLLQRDVCRR